MKKLVIAAVAAAVSVTGVLADCATPTTATGGAYVYTFKASVKTADPSSTTADVGCTQDVKTCYRKKASRTIQGLLIACKCADLKTGTPTAWFYVLTSSSKYLVGDDSINGTATYSTSLYNFIGAPTAAKSTVAQGLFAFGFQEKMAADTSKIRTYVLQAAGFGTQSAGVLKNLSGQITGSLTTSDCACSTLPSNAYNPCDLVVVGENDAVGGTWTLVYNSALSKYAATNGGLTGLAVAKKAFPKASFPTTTY